MLCMHGEYASAKDRGLKFGMAIGFQLKLCFLKFGGVRSRDLGKKTTNLVFLRLLFQNCSNFLDIRFGKLNGNAKW